MHIVWSSQCIPSPIRRKLLQERKRIPNFSDVAEPTGWVTRHRRFSLADHSYGTIQHTHKTEKANSRTQFLVDWPLNGKT